jgi:hypothetical protein
MTDQHVDEMTAMVEVVFNNEKGDLLALVSIQQTVFSK